MTLAEATSTARNLSETHGGVFFIVRGADGGYGPLSDFQHQAIARNNPAWALRLDIVAMVCHGKTHAA